MLPLSFVFDGSHVRFVVLRDGPVIALAWWATAALMWGAFLDPQAGAGLRALSAAATVHTFRKMRLRYRSHTGTKQTAVKLIE